MKFGKFLSQGSGGWKEGGKGSSIRLCQARLLLMTVAHRVSCSFGKSQSHFPKRARFLLRIQLPKSTILFCSGNNRPLYEMAFEIRSCKDFEIPQELILQRFNLMIHPFWDFEGCEIKDRKVG